MQMPNKSPEPTAVGAVSSAIAVHVARRRWLSFLRSATFAFSAKQPFMIFGSQIRISVISGVFALFCAACRADDAEQYYLTSTNSRDQRIQLDFAVSRERLAAQPDWSPTNRDIPLEPQQAAAIA